MKGKSDKENVNVLRTVFCLWNLLVSSRSIQTLSCKIKPQAESAPVCAQLYSLMAQLPPSSWLTTWSFWVPW